MLVSLSRSPIGSQSVSSSAAAADSRQQHTAEEVSIAAKREADSSQARIDAAIPSAELVAEVIAGSETVDEACRALRSSGWRSTISGRRIAVSDRVFARHVADSRRADGSAASQWVVYGIADRPAVRIVVVSRDRCAEADCDSKKHRPDSPNREDSS